MKETLTISDVRSALWKAYKKAEELGGIEGKSSEGRVELYFLTFWECKTEEEFLEPSGIMVYSYALGPSRSHFFYKSDKESNPDYNTWYSKNIYKKAIEVINSWVELRINEDVSE